VPTLHHLACGFTQHTDVADAHAQTPEHEPVDLLIGRCRVPPAAVVKKMQVQAAVRHGDEYTARLARLELEHAASEGVSFDLDTQPGKSGSPPRGYPCG